MKITSVRTLAPSVNKVERSPVIGIPRALGYYEYLPLWRTFFEALGCTVVISPTTNKSLLDQGVRAAVDEACLPIKVYYGHVKSLAGKVDCVFIPRMISVEEKTYVCPKFLGVPDMLRAATDFDQAYPPMIITNVNRRLSGGGWEQALAEAGSKLAFSRSKVREALKVGRKAQEDFEMRLERGEFPLNALARWEKSGRLLDREGNIPMEPPKPVERTQDPRGPVIAVIGHPYQLFDSFTSMNLLAKLKETGARIITSMAVDKSQSLKATSHLPKRLFWSFGQKLLGGSLHLMNQPIDGLIYVAAFGCGPDSMVGELVERHARRYGQIPYLLLTIDEHTGEAGVVTRLEAFLDLIARRKHESYISSHGQYGHCPQGTAGRVGVGSDYPATHN